MRRTWALILGGVIGCGGPAPIPMEVLDAGAVSVPDTGPVDADVSPTDAGTACEITVSPSQFDALQSQCLPRCSAATRESAFGCTESGCFWAALDQDTTPASTILTNGHPASLDCFSCVAVQYEHCAVVAGCAAETYVNSVCDPSTDEDHCLVEHGAFDACVVAHRAAFDACFGGAADQCFE